MAEVWDAHFGFLFATSTVLIGEWGGPAKSEADRKWQHTVVDYIVRSRQYVTYPPEGERPPTTREEVRARHAELRARLDAQAEAEGRRRGAGAAGAG